MNAKQYREQRDAAWAVLRKVKLAHYVSAQPFALSGLVTPQNPGGQFTAHLPDGTPVNRSVIIREAREAVALLSMKG